MSHEEATHWGKEEKSPIFFDPNQPLAQSPLTPPSISPKRTLGAKYSKCSLLDLSDEDNDEDDAFADLEALIDDEAELLSPLAKMARAEGDTRSKGLVELAKDSMNSIGIKDTHAVATRRNLLREIEPSKAPPSFALVAGDAKTLGQSHKIISQPHQVSRVRLLEANRASTSASTSSRPAFSLLEASRVAKRAMKSREQFTQWAMPDVSIEKADSIVGSRPQHWGRSVEPTRKPLRRLSTVRTTQVPILKHQTVPHVKPKPLNPSASLIASSESRVSPNLAPTCPPADDEGIGDFGEDDVFSSPLPPPAARQHKRHLKTDNSKVLSTRFKQLRDQLDGDLLRLQSGQYPFRGLGHQQRLDVSDPRRRASSYMDVTLVGFPVPWADGGPRVVVQGWIHAIVATANDAAPEGGNEMGSICFGNDTAREHGLKPGLQLRIYNAIALPGREEHEPRIILCTQLCERYPDLLPALPGVPDTRSDEGFTANDGY